MLITPRVVGTALDASRIPIRCGADAGAPELDQEQAVPVPLVHAAPELAVGTTRGGAPESPRRSCSPRPRQAREAVHDPGDHLAGHPRLSGIHHADGPHQERREEGFVEVAARAVGERLERAGLARAVGQKNDPGVRGLLGVTRG